MASTSAVKSGALRASSASAASGEQLARRRRHVPARTPLAERGQQRRQLEQRVVGDHRHGRVAGGAVGHEREPEDALLADRHRVDGLAAQAEGLAAALVEQVVAAREVGPLGGQPLGAGAVLLLVGHRDHQQVAACRAPAFAGE
jgi:hypothetical protein